MMPEPPSWDEAQCEAATDLGLTLVRNASKPQKRHLQAAKPCGKSPYNENVSYYYYYLIRSEERAVKGGPAPQRVV